MPQEIQVKNKIKPTSDVVACVIDYGTFTSIAEKLSETMKEVFYYSPYEEEYQDIRRHAMGMGIPKVTKINDIFEPEIFNKIDLFIFPDIGYGGLQKHLKSLGKAVWGTMGVNDIEISRTLFVDVIKQAGLPIIHSEKITGMTALRNYLQTVSDKYIKINRYRANMETWHHIDYNHSKLKLDSMDVIFGGMKEKVQFVVQDKIDTVIEAGYDGWCIDGNFPKTSFQGYEKKNELYLGSLLPDKDIPDAVKFVNQKMAPLLKKFGYRDWWATEIRVTKDGTPYFIDPTPRMPGQTGEHQIENCLNFSEIIWYGANGIMIDPKWGWKFAAEATLHYDAGTLDPAISMEWKALRIPKETKRWVKFYHYCRDGETIYFVPGNDEVGVVIGVGNTVQAALDHLNRNLDELKSLPLHAEVAGFADLLKSIQKAQKEGINFAKKVPSPQTVVKMI